MGFPKTTDEMKAAGYVFEDESFCKACGASIERMSTPRGKKLPIDLTTRGSDTAVPHWSTCPNADDFRKG